jgi:hypothetical protein
MANSDFGARKMAPDFGFPVFEYLNPQLSHRKPLFPKFYSLHTGLWGKPISIIGFDLALANTRLISVSPVVRGIASATLLYG